MKFRYVKGGKEISEGRYGKIENAIYYKLLEKKLDGSYEELARHEMVTGLMSMDKGQGILGSIGDNGKPFERDNQLNGYEQVNEGKYIPLAELTDNGYAYYLRFEFYMKPKSRGVYLTPILVSGRLYLDSQKAVNTISYSNTMTVKSDGIYLNTNLGEVNVYKRDIDNVDDKEAEVFMNAHVYSAPENYHRTDYIPITVLTDGLDGGYCLGAITNDPIMLNDVMYTLAFYDEDLSFLCGVTRDEIYNMFNRNPCYLDKEEIGQLMASKLGEDGYNTAKYLIFSSYNKDDNHSEGSTTADLVSTEVIYFPLNHLDVDSIFERGSKLVVQAIGDGFFVEDSEYSNAEPKDEE